MGEAEVRPIEAANRAAWNASGAKLGTWAEQMRDARAAANPPAVHRLACPTAEHGEGIVLYVRDAEGWCHCLRKLRPLAMDERLVKIGDTVRTVKR
jgi:hypothetical protein